MEEHLLPALLAAVFLVLEDLGFWTQICILLSMKYERIDATEIMIRAPYRILWLPKIVVGSAQFLLFIASAHNYGNGGRDPALGVAWVVSVLIYLALVGREGIRAFRQYEQGIRR